MLSKKPIDCEKISKENKDKEFLRLALVSELDAISLYEQIADNTDNEDIKKVMLDIAKEEKTHIGEFQALLLKLDDEQVDELINGKKEVQEILSGEEQGESEEGEEEEQ